MKNAISKNLIDLANLLDKPIYIVGGAVRDFLLGNKIQDIDLAGSMSPKEIAKQLKGTKFHITKTTEKLGTVRIVVNGETFEYTTFRKDSYDLLGGHTPIEVGFVDDIVIDSKRRDFTINAIYYDLLSDEFLDFNNGILDLKNKVLRTPKDPKQTFQEDALRILRVIRFAAELGFLVEEKTYEAAKEMLPGIKNISHERIQDEFNKIILADSKNNIKNAHVKGFLGLHKLGMLEYIFPEILSCIGVKQNPKFHKYKVFEHIIEVFKNSKPVLTERLAALLHDLGKANYKNQLNMSGHAKESVLYSKAFLERMKYSKAITNKVLIIVKTHMFDSNQQQTELERMHFIQENYKYIDDIISFKKADIKGKTDSIKLLNIPLEKTKKEMEKNKIPFEIKDLPVSGKDLIELSIEESKRTKALQSLLKETAKDYTLKNRANALEYIKNNFK
ncbi:MAG TPA: CCA tRNA nucleotidyltransferase [Clostridiales bacterium]|nr:CCA tRNA nucleotidyltransferase [Clostridiales bacterium]